MQLYWQFWKYLKPPIQGQDTLNYQNYFYHILLLYQNNIIWILHHIFYVRIVDVLVGGYSSVGIFVGRTAAPLKVGGTTHGRFTGCFLKQKLKIGYEETIFRPFVDPLYIQDVAIENTMLRICTQGNQIYVHDNYRPNYSCYLSNLVSYSILQLQSFL